MHVNWSQHGRLRNAVVLLVLALLTVPEAGMAQDAGTPELSLEAIFSSSTFRSQGFQGGRWTESGPVVTYIEPAEDGEATHLIRYNLETGERERLIDGTTLYADDVGRLIEIEDYAYGPNEEQVLIYTDSERVWRLNTKGYYYVYDLDTRDLTPVADRDDGFQMFAKFSPTGEAVAFVRDRNLFLTQLPSMEVVQLTTSGGEGTIINGTSDWVYEEEFGLRDGFAWSPDGRHIAFFQLDETDTRSFVMADLRGQYPELTEFRYPKAGEQNSEIRIGVVDVEQPDYPVSFFDTGTWNAGGDSLEYIPQMGWTPLVDGAHRVWIFRMNRDQNDLDVLYGNPQTMALRTVLEETEETWIDVETGFSDLDVGQLTYLEDDEHFVWISERDGYRHLYLYQNDGTFVRQLTDGPWDVTDFHGIDEERGRAYFSGTVTSPIERHLYYAPVAVEGSNGQASEPVKVTEDAGWHDVDMSADLRYYLDDYSSVTTPPVVTLHTADGEQLQVLEPNERLRETVARYDLPEPELTMVPGADDVELYASVIRPRDFDPSREYPLLMYVYGGPGNQEVRNEWSAGQGTSRYLWHQYMADRHGVLVATVDNRGSAGRGKAFKSAPYRQLGQLEARDQIAAAQYFGGQSYVDAGRIGIWGWSYGGFMTLMAMMMDEGPQTFDAGMSVAPVTDWRQYDTIYTERYMSTPQNNPEGYQSAPINYVDNLRADQDLLLVHGDMDDNVHFQNSIQLVDALIEAGKQFDYMVYPGRNHSIYGGNTRYHLFQLLTQFVQENLVEDEVAVLEAGQ